MSAPTLVSLDELIACDEARVTAIAWALRAYPMLRIPSVSEAFIRERLTSPFVGDAEVATRLVAELLNAPSACVEPTLMGRLLEERRYGARLYEEARGDAARYWRGSSALGCVTSRALPDPAPAYLVVLSPWSRLETMLALIGSDWATQVSTVVCADDLIGQGDLASLLVAEALRRIDGSLFDPADLSLKSTIDALHRAFERIVAPG